MAEGSGRTETVSTLSEEVPTRDVSTSRSRVETSRKNVDVQTETTIGTYLNNYSYTHPNQIPGYAPDTGTCVGHVYGLFV